ncbi:MAG: glycerophosphodiester phosphodiesterase family protein [Bacteroidota bacterium]
MRFTTLLFLGSLGLLVACDTANSDSNSSNTQKMTPSPLPTFDWQGHRGARGLLPENTVPAFLKAMELNMRTLEMDAAVSKEGTVIISHEPWFSHEISTTPDGQPVTDEMEKNYLIHQMTDAEISAFDVGSRGNERFPEQQKMKVHKPTLAEVVAAINKYCSEKNAAQPYYNIEIKSRPEWDNELAPIPAKFAKVLLDEVNRLGIHDQTYIQSFDPRSLLAVNELDKTIMTAYLIENINPFAENMEKLDFIPTIYSPYYQLVTDTLVKDVYTAGMDLIPWTVNKVADMKRLKTLGVDGIITDYPNLVNVVDNHNE